MSTTAPAATGAPAPAAPRRLTLVLATVWLVVTLWCAAGIPVRATYGAQTTADEPQYLLTAISLYTDRDLDIADELAERRWTAFHEAELPEQTRPLPGGRRLSPHDPLLPLLLAVPAGLGGWAGAKLAMAGLAGLLAVLLVWTAVRRLRVPLVPATVAVLACALSPPLAVYATQLYPELVAALAVAVALAVLPAVARSPGAAVAAGLAITALPWLGTKYAPVAAVLALAAAWVLRGRGWRPLLVFGGGLALAGAVYVLGHLAIYGGLTPYAVGDHFTGGELDVVGTTPNYAGRTIRLTGLLTDRTFGLIPWAPVWLLAVPALAAVVRRREGRVLAGVLAAGWLTATYVALTMHGWWWPGRQVVVVLPAAVLALAMWARGRWVVVTGMAGLIGAVNFACLVAAGIPRRLTWVVDFYQVAAPYRLLRPLLPDGLTVTPVTWVLHAVWAALLAGLAVAGWRSARRDPAVSSR
jgi:hypothetical protein